MGTTSSTPTPTTQADGAEPQLAADEADLVARVLRFHGDCEDLPSLEWIVEMCQKDPARTRIFMSKLLDLTAPEEGKVMRFAPFRQPDPGMLHVTAASGFRFDLTDELDREAALAACTLDPRVSKVKPQLVRSSQLTEGSFFKNYFTHVTRVRRWLFSGLGSEAEDVMIAARRSASINIDDSHFVVGGEHFTSHTAQLSGLSFTSYAELARFVGRAKPANPPLPSRLVLAASADSATIDKKAVMRVLRVSAPSFLSVMLEDVAARKASGLSDKFWSVLKVRILDLSAHVETFTDMELLRPETTAQESFASLFQAANEFQFDPARDREALQAAWDLDPSLATPFRKLIPQHISKGRFWNRYFHKVIGLTIEQLANHS